MLNDEIISELNILIESVKNDLINDSIGKETIENFMQDEQLVQRVSSCYKKRLQRSLRFNLQHGNQKSNY